MGFNLSLGAAVSKIGDSSHIVGSFEGVRRPTAPVPFQAPVYRLQDVKQKPVLQLSDVK